MNQLTKTLSLLLITFAAANGAFSQENFASGYIVQNTGDTIHGLIDYRNWRLNPQKIEFKTNSESEKRVYKPLEIASFQVGGELYESGIVDTEITPITNKPVLEPELKIVVDTAFVHVLYRGEKSLYYYITSEGRKNFYIRHGDDPAFDLLVYKIYLNRLEDKDVISSNRRYLGQLTLYLSECSTIQKALANTSYDEYSLMELFMYYYGCNPSVISHRSNLGAVQELTWKKEFGASLGFSSTSFVFGEHYPSKFGTSYSKSINPTLVGHLDFMTEGKFQNLKFRNELQLSKFKSSTSNATYHGVLLATEYINAGVGFTTLDLNHLIKYEYPIKKMTYSIYMGFSNSFPFAETNYETNRLIYKDYFLPTKTKESKIIDNDVKRIFSYFFGTELGYKKWFLQYRFVKGKWKSNFRIEKNIWLMGYRF
jgi:hypothetical protein